MRKKATHTLLSALILFLACFLCSYHAYVFGVNQLSANFTTPNGMKFRLYDLPLEQFAAELTTDGVLKEDTALYDVSLEEVFLRVIHHPSSVLSPHMVEGRFFEAADCGPSSDPKAVIGKAYLPETSMEDGVRKIKLFDRSYSVIGVMGYTDNYSLNKYVYVNTREEDPEFPVLFLLDSPDGKSVTTAAEEIQSKYQVRKIEGKANDIDRMFHYRELNRRIYLVVTALILALLAYLLYLQSSYFDASIRVFYLLGSAPGTIKKWNRKLYCFSARVCFPCAVGLMGLVFFFFDRVMEIIDLFSVYRWMAAFLLGYVLLEECVLRLIWRRWRRKHERMHRE